MIETVVYTVEELRKRFIFLNNVEEKPYVALAQVSGKIVDYKWFNNRSSACMWALEQSYNRH